MNRNTEQVSADATSFSTNIESPARRVQVSRGTNANANANRRKEKDDKDRRKASAKEESRKTDQRSPPEETQLHKMIENLLDFIIKYFLGF